MSTSSTRPRSLRPVFRALVLALTGSIAFAGVASADIALADGDLVEPDAQTTIDLGAVLPGAEVAVPVRFVLMCTGTQHVDTGQTVAIAWLPLQSTPGAGGSFASVTATSFGLVPAGWPADGASCPEDLPTHAAAAASLVTLRAPTAVGNDLRYVVRWGKTLSPAGNGDADAVGRSASSLTITLDVVANTPPTLALPGSMTVEGDRTGGWLAAYAVSATDAEDEPDPVPTCVPAAGSLLPPGTTTVACSVTDSGGQAASGSFPVTVVDSLAPTLTGVPGGATAATTDPAGAAVTFAVPAATDVVDPNPSVGCAPASGSVFPIGTTTVTCTASDQSGNTSSASFAVTVTRTVPADAGATATFLEPVMDGSSLLANHGRTVPVKVRLSVDGRSLTDGLALLEVRRCGGGDPVLHLPLAFHADRSNAHLDTSALPSSGCWTVAAVVDGDVAGTFDLELRGEPPAVSRSAEAKDAKGKPPREDGKPPRKQR